MHPLPSGNREGGQADGNRSLGQGPVDGTFGRYARRFDLRSRSGCAQSAAERVQVFSGGAGEAARELVMKMLRPVQVSFPRKREPIFQRLGCVAPWGPPTEGPATPALRGNIPGGGG